MKKDITRFRILLSALFIFFFSSINFFSVRASNAQNIGSQITGQVIDLNCWLGSGVKGPSHRQCAQECANLGTPLAILTDDGRIYYPALEMMPTGPQKNNELLIPYAEERVVVKGKIISRGQERAIIIKSVMRANNK